MCAKHWLFITEYVHIAVIFSWNGMPFLYNQGQKFVKFVVGFLENLRNQKDILRLADLYYANKVGGNVVNSLRSGALQACIDCCLDTFTRQVKKIENYF